MTRATGVDAISLTNLTITGLTVTIQWGTADPGNTLTLTNLTISG